MRNKNFRLAFFLAVFMAVVGTSYARQKLECYVDEEKDKMDPNNIYKCEMDQLCCREEGKPSCCMEKDSTEARLEQVQLWGTLAGLIVILALVMFCCRHDGDCCCNRKDGGRYQYWCCGPIIYREGKQPPQPTDDLEDLDNDDAIEKVKMPTQSQIPIKPENPLAKMEKPDLAGKAANAVKDASIV